MFSCGKSFLISKSVTNTMAIIISKDGKNAQKIDKTNIQQEDYLQKYIYDNPEAIPLYEIKEDTKLLILCREFPTNSGPIDAIGIDKEGQLYIIETKLYKNPDKRLVVAQILDYGAALWKHYIKFEDFLLKIENGVRQNFNTSFAEKVMSFYEIGEEDVQNIYGKMKSDLEVGNFKFVVLMDKLSDHLRDLIIYLNQNSNFDFFAVELDYYEFENLEIMIPKLFGNEVRKSIGAISSSERKRWNEDSFFEDVRKRNPEKVITIIENLYEFGKTFAEDISFGTGTDKGSITPKININNKKVSLFSVFSNGDLMLPFPTLNLYKENPEIIREFIENLKLIPGFEFEANENRYPTVFLNNVAEHNSIEQFKQVLKDYVNKLKR